MHRTFFLGLLSLVLMGQAPATSKVATESVIVEYAGITEAQARSMANVLQAARTIAVDKYKLDMPAVLRLRVDCKAENRVRLFNDGDAVIIFSLHSPDALRKPEQSGTFVVYGLCHELGHIAMYRALREHAYLSNGGAEGWAHYIGSRLVDDVFAASVDGAEAGEKLWWDPYDYRADGMRRLDKQINTRRKDPTNLGAARWKELAGVLGDEKFGELFRAWARVAPDPADPGPSLRGVTTEVGGAEAANWLIRSQGDLFRRAERSGFNARTVTAAELSGHPRELIHDDTQSFGKRSIAGGGHAVRLTAPGPGWYLTRVKVFASRYGPDKPPAKEFSVWLLDGAGKAVREWKLPYSTFNKGEPEWVELTLEPTEVPTDFMVSLVFNPTVGHGVYVHHDRENSGASLMAVPDAISDDKPRGDWMIRATLDLPKAADALRPPARGSR